MKFIKDYDSATRYYDLDSQTLLYDNSGLSVSGWFRKEGENLTAIYVEEGSLILLINDTKYEVGDQTYVEVKTTSSAAYAIFELLENHKKVAEVRYKVGERYNIQPPFEYLDDEDFDWGVFIAGIVNDKLRKRNFIEEMMNPNRE